VKVALRTQQIIASETGVTKTVDPIGGSYYVEYLTQTIEEEVEKYLKKIQSLGGALAAVEKGFFQDEIRKNAYRLKKEIDSTERIIVGVNKYQDTKDVEPKISVLDNEIESRQVSRLKEFKINRDRSKVEAAISALQTSAEDPNQNLMPQIINAVQSNVTLGEISAVFKEVFGVFEPRVAF
jgi:methylmalonyl-CoA mutase N-terminal domain/subunit